MMRVKRTWRKIQIFVLWLLIKHCREPAGVSEVSAFVDLHVQHDAFFCVDTRLRAANGRRLSVKAFNKKFSILLASHDDEEIINVPTEEQRADLGLMERLSLDERNYEACKYNCKGSSHGSAVDLPIFVIAEREEVVCKNISCEFHNQRDFIGAQADCTKA